MAQTTKKNFLCATFASYNDGTIDVVAGHGNGRVYSFHLGQEKNKVDAIEGGVTVCIYSNEKVFCGGMGGIIKVSECL